jgi:hypothetical protein
MNVTVGGATAAGTYAIAITGNGGGLSHVVTASLIVSSTAPPLATFLTTDTTTQGNWRGTYGTEGYSIANYANSYPSYAQVSFSNQSNYTWASSTSEVRALQKTTGNGRIASTWYSPTSFTIDVNLVDGNWHQVGLYCLDWETGRVQTIDVLDPATSVILDSRTISVFSSGHYLFWNVKGHVAFRVTRSGTYNGVVSGLFFK